MSEIDYENDNKSILDSCCKIIDSASVVKKLKDRKKETRRSIEDIIEQKRLRKEFDID